MFAKKPSRFRIRYVGKPGPRARSRRGAMGTAPRAVSS